ncbi:hypothetical protein B0H21DRAFT_819887 [Amylocystis lapponica]|nr:hypothetical protein B0H21DRAFT_819887 [Amylocystis lapponica]
MTDFILTPNKRVHARQPDCGFAVPPLDGSLTVPQIFDWHYEHNSNHPIFVYKAECGDLVHHTYAEMVPAAHRAAQYVAKKVGIDLSQDPSTYPTVAIFAASDSISYFTTLIGMFRAGIPVFPISPRFSVPVVTHLLSITGVSHVLISAEPSIDGIAQDAVDGLRTRAHDSQVPGLSRMPLYEDLYMKNASFTPLPSFHPDLSSTAIILHSSGSTSFPKPIRWTARAMLQYAVMPWFGTHDLCGQVLACPAMELFHAMAVLLLCALPATGYIMSTLRPASPAIAPTADTAMQVLVDTNASYAAAPPGFIGMWARDPECIAFLRQMKCLMYGGRFLSKAVGDFLAGEGVDVYTLYGTQAVYCKDQDFVLTRCLNIECMGVDWEYFALNAHCATEFVPVGGGVHKLYIMSKPTQDLDPAIINAKVHGQDAYDTGDFLIPHPDKADHWKVLGRIDDQIMLASGDVINPCPLGTSVVYQDRLCGHPSVASAMLIGRGKAHVGVLFELNSEDAFDPQDEEKLDLFRDAVWSSVEEINEAMPIFARVIKQMIIVTSTAKPFTFTAKGGLRRAVILHQYQSEIDALYSGSRERNLPAPMPLVAL